MKRERGGASIPCPRCGGPTRVLQTRRNTDKTVRRERTCLVCEIVFDTQEARNRKKTVREVGAPAVAA